MSDTTNDEIVLYYQATHEQLLGLVDGLSDKQLMWRPNVTTPSIAFHTWHMARWADCLQAFINDWGEQIWDTEELAEQWGFGQADLGYLRTGMGLDDDVSASLPLPTKDRLLDYVSRAFAQADEAVSTAADDGFHQNGRFHDGTQWQERSISGAVLESLAHDSRHLGMIECLLGVQGAHGTATV
jgi:uncharacterized damage-inducible protein DinB